METTLEALAEAWEGACCPTDTTEPGGGRASDFVWEEHREFPLGSFGPRQQWIEWYAQEREMWFADYGDNERFDGLEAYWKGQPDDPIFAVEDGGKFYLWDGNHRVGISNMLGQSTIHAIIGRRK